MALRLSKGKCNLPITFVQSPGHQMHNWKTDCFELLVIIFSVNLLGSGLQVDVCKLLTQP